MSEYKKKNIYVSDEVGQFPFYDEISWNLEKPRFEKFTLDQIKERYRNVISKEEIKRIEDVLNPPLKYLETLPKAYEIYNKLSGEPKSHREWAERFNIVGDINEIIMRK